MAEKVENQHIPIVRECDVGRSDSGYVVLRIKGVGAFAFPANTARDVARELVKSADLVDSRDRAN